MVFGPKPRDFSKKVSRKTRALALRKALSERLLAGDVIVVDELSLKTHKTKDLAGIVATLGGRDKHTLVVTEQVDKNLKLAARNLPKVQVEPVGSVNVYELLRFEKIVTTKAALEKLGARLG